MNFLARILSYLFHPVVFFLVMPFLVVYRQTENSFYAVKWAIFSTIFIFLGFILFLLGRLKGTFSDHDISKKEERHKFYVILFFLAFIYLITALFFKGVLFPLSIIVFGLILGMIVFDFVDYYVKASVHIGVVAAFVVALSVLYGTKAFWATFWVVPIVFWARIKLEKHTAEEGVIGGLLGTGITILTFVIGKYLYSI